MKRRIGFSLAEVMVAVALAAGPVLLAVHLIHTNVTAARFNVDQATARQALVDLTELLLGEPIESLREVSKPEAQRQLDELFTKRLARLPEKAKKQYASQMKDFLGKFKCSLDENAGNVQGLVKLSLSVQMSKSTVKVARYFRPDARLMPAQVTPGTTPPPSTGP
jgi:hypothetical protein